MVSHLVVVVSGKVSHGVGPVPDGLGHGAVGASGGVFAVSGLGHGASQAVGRGWICGRTDPLGLMVERRHEAWQGATVIKTPLPWAKSRELAKWQQ